jgi:23S rRNA (uracil1939-C5)-methyltransferase
MKSKRDTLTMQQGNLVEIEIADLSSSGDGVGRVGEYVVFVPDTVPGDRASVRLVQVKQHYAHGKLHQLLQPSPHRIRPRCIVADKCGGCQWQHVSDAYQQVAKRQQVIQALERIGGFSQPPVAPLLALDSTLGYRNKVTYPFGLSTMGHVQAGYYRRHSHRLINLNQCPVQDSRLNPLLAEIKRDIEQQGWSIYDENRHQGQLRHLSLRIGRRTGEILLTLVTTDWDLSALREQADLWLERYPQLVGVALNYNPERTNVIFGGETRTIAGQSYVREIFAGLEFHLRSDTFFQVNTEAAEALLHAIEEHLDLQGTEMLVDAYCGIGTFTLPLARQVEQAIGIEVQAAAVEQARENARLNGIDNATFAVGEVETILSQLDRQPDIVLLDPPRQGCDRAVTEMLEKLQSPQLVYISCKPSTLARDLKLLCQAGTYQLISVLPLDFFPQTAHVECAAFLQR